VILKFVPKAGHESTLENFNQDCEEETEQKFDMTYGTIFGISKFFFQRSQQKI
jgi:hypothetical protein